MDNLKRKYRKINEVHWSPFQCVFGLLTLLVIQMSQIKSVGTRSKKLTARFSELMHAEEYFLYQFSNLFSISETDT